MEPVDGTMRRVLAHALDAVVIRPAVVAVQIAFPLSKKVGNDRLKLARQNSRLEVRSHPTAHGLNNFGSRPVPLPGTENCFVRGDVGSINLMQECWLLRED